MSTVLSTGRADTKAYFTEGYNRGHDYDMQNTCMLVIARYPIPYNSMTVPTIVRVSGPPWYMAIVLMKTTAWDFAIKSQLHRTDIMSQA